MKIENLKLTEVEKLKLEDKLNDLDMNYEEYVSHLVKRDINGAVYLDNGFMFDKNKNVLFNTLGDEIKMTGIEIKLFKLLLDNRGSIVKLDDIHSIAWKGKEMSRFSLRNKISSLRDKTFYELIKNHSNIGYSMN